MTNLYEFLRKMLDSSYVSLEDRQWLEEYLKVPENRLDFKSRRVGGTDENPVMAQDYAIAGTQMDIFCLITEAMMQNPTFAEMIQGAAKFFQDHVPTCEHCGEAVKHAMTKPSWEFNPHP
jgi:hypothetical protein